MGQSEQNIALAAVPIVPTTAIIFWALSGYPKLWFPVAVLFVVSMFAFMVSPTYSGDVNAQGKKTATLLWPPHIRQGALTFRANVP
jgi:hypothetical protein